jgi:uncharacterized protein (DUF1697 family)
MTIWVALFRGVNVGGHNLLPMKDLTATLEEIGCTRVKTYIRSGNVVFSKADSKAPLLARLIEKTVFKRHGFEPKVLLLTVRALEKAVQLNPFPDAVADPKSLHFLFLAEKPLSPDYDSLNQIKSDSESYALKGGMFYLHAPDGIGRSKLAARAEKLLGVSATGRNWRTVSALLDLAKRNK